MSGWAGRCHFVTSGRFISSRLLLGARASTQKQRFGGTRSEGNVSATSTLRWSFAGVLIACVAIATTIGARPEPLLDLGHTVSAMNERQMEIIVSRGIGRVLGTGHQLQAQQVGVGGGRLDLLVSRPDGTRMVVELKKGRLASKHVDQVRRYAETLSTDAGMAVEAMVIANEASSRMLEFAEEGGVHVETLSESRLSELAKQIGLSESDLLGDRRKDGVLFGGGSGLRTSVPLQTALKECPEPIKRLVKSLDAGLSHSRFRAGTSQMVLHYRGIKVGGLNRRERGGHTYVSTGVVLSADHKAMLDGNLFFPMTRNTTGTHDHIWWERRWDGSEYARQSNNAFRFFFNVIDEVLR